ncbi:hypothetical protein ACIQK5_10220 [Streptomyces virginiae]|uniref:hypothetical protein n=1 Tax=Streptomyces TaxID=1883 RepID=UPI001368103B|nr:hypothetical protein [Streptomyces sp. SID1046]MYV79659.1 hypothetical protein [Streptomyces sp. SID1046]
MTALELNTVAEGIHRAGRPPGRVADPAAAIGAPLPDMRDALDLLGGLTLVQPSTER